MLKPTNLSGHDFNLHSEPNFYSYSNFLVCSVSSFISAIAFISRHVRFYFKFARGNHISLAECTIHMVFTTEAFFEVAIESLPEWDLNPQQLNSVHMLKPTNLSGHDFNLHSEPNFYSYSNFLVCSVSSFISAIAFISRHVRFYFKFARGNHISLAECTIHMVFTTEAFFEVAIESLPEWDLNPQQLNSVHML